LKLGLDRAASALLSCLSLASFSDLLFGSIPESFGLGAMAMAFVLLLAVDALCGDAPVKPGLWVAGGTLAVGITVTHMVEVLIVAFIVLRSKRLKPSRAIAGAAALGLVVGLLTVGLYELGRRAYGAPSFSPLATGQIQELGKPHNPVEVALAFSDTLLPSPPLALAYEEVRQPHEFILTYRKAVGPVPGRTPRALVVFLVLVVCGLGWRNAPPRQRMCGLMAGALLAFHFLFFLVYGTELFLYSAHWELPLVLTAAGAFFHTGRLRRLALLGLAGFTLLLALNSALVWTSIFRALTAPH
jgi:hypothetical protein